MRCVPHVESMRMPSGHLRHYSNTGGYPVLYLDQHDNVLCGNCANSPDDEYTIVSAAAVNYGDPCLHCDQCSERIESAYAEDCAEGKCVTDDPNALCCYCGGDSANGELPHHLEDPNDEYLDSTKGGA